MVRFAIFLARLFRKPVSLLGADYDQFEALLRTKLTLDSRSETGSLGGGQKKQKFAYQLLFFGIYGLVMGLMITSAKNLASSMIIFFIVLIVLLGVTLIGEFTSVLFDHRDNLILLPRPVSQRTLLLLRIAHIQFYIGYIAFAFSLATGIILIFRYNLITSLAFFVASGLCAWFTLEFTTLIYLFVSRIVDGEKFKDILTYVQIITAVFLYAGYQLISRTAFITEDLSHNEWWNYLLPPYWFAALASFAGGAIKANEIAMSITAIVIPLGGAVILIRFLSSGFETILAAGSSESIRPQSETFEIKRKGVFRELFCSTSAEKAGWDLAMATTKRDRKFKQNVYPFFGVMLVFAFFMIRPADHTPIKEMGAIGKILFILITGYAGSAAILQLPYTDSPDAAWIFRSLPLQKHGFLLSGAIKAMLFRFYLPFHLLILVVSVILWGIKFTPQVLLGLSATVFLTLVVVVFNVMKLPFTESREMQNKGSMSVNAILMVLLLSIIGGLLYLTTLFPAWIAIILLAGFVFLISVLFRHIGSRNFI